MRSGYCALLSTNEMPSISIPKKAKEDLLSRKIIDQAELIQ